ncbi:Unknown protein sequence [Pseudomonas amygdali pv. sesami]|nr:Unknown protein sequence [Pseudomonas amygdali pv. sesami]
MFLGIPMAGNFLLSQRQRVLVLILLTEHLILSLPCQRRIVK